MEVEYDYTSLLRRFWKTAGAHPGYRGNFGGLFSAMMSASEEDNTNIVAEKYAHWKKITHIGKEEYYTAIKWLNKHGYIIYEEGSGAIPAKITLKLGKKKKVGSPTSLDTSSRPISVPTPDLIDHSRAQVRLENINKPPIVPQETAVQNEPNGGEGLVGVTPYEVFMDRYQKPGDPFMARSIWESYSEEKRQLILASLDGYLETVQGDRAKYKQQAVKFFTDQTWRAFPPKEVKPKSEVYQDIERKDLPVKPIVPYFFLTNTKL